MIKKIFLLGTIALSACGGTNKNSEKVSNKKNAKIAFIGSSLERHRVKVMSDSLGTLKTKFGYNVGFYDSDNDVINELENTKKAIENNAEVLIFDLISGFGVESVKYAKEKNKKVVILTNKINGVEVDGFVLPDYLDAGKKLAVNVKKEIGLVENFNFDLQNSVYMMGSKASPYSKTKHNGFTREWKEFVDGEIKTSNYNKILAASKSKKLINNNEYINLWISDSPNTTLGILSTLKDKFGNENLLKKSKKVVAGYGYNPDIEEEMQKGNVLAVATYDWKKVIETGLRWADSLIKNSFEQYDDIKKAYYEDNRVIKIDSIIKKRGK